MVTGEKGLPRVKVFTADGKFESVVAGTESFAANVKACADPGDCTKGGLDIAVDSRGRIHILDRVTAEIRVLQPKKGRA
jgi:streptogramin lyase